MNTILLFALCTAVNVILSTIKSILTVKGGKFSASFINAITYGFYSYVIVLTSADGMPIWLKMAITAVCNFVGVYLVKWIEEKARKDKLWKVELTVPTKYTNTIDFDLHDVPHSYIELSDKHTLFNFYCATQKESAKVKAIANQYEAKYFVAESKNLE
jgi:hypothetical protein